MKATTVSQVYLFNAGLTTGGAIRWFMTGDAGSGVWCASVAAFMFICYLHWRRP